MCVVCARKYTLLCLLSIESADNTYTVMHNPRSKDKGESAGSNEQEDIYIVMHPHPAFLPMIKKHFKNSKSK